MSNAPKKLTQPEIVPDEPTAAVLAPDEQKHLVSFFNVLIEIDRQNLDDGKATFYTLVGITQ